MKQIHLFLAAFAAIAVIGTSASAQTCYADYKAKRDNPLRLHYGVVQLKQACSNGSARTEIAARLSGSGWTLLNVVSVFGPEGLPERKDSAGPFYLRF